MGIINTLSKFSKDRPYMIKNPAVEKISILALVLLITGSIDSIRNLPATALFGSTLIFFFILSAIIFLIPVALVSAELSSTWPEDEGGVYSWVRHAFGSGPAFFAIWLQWINTVVWYPTIISFIAGTLAHLINPELAANKLFIVGVILIIFWSLTIVGISGIRASANIAGICAFVGMIIPMGFIILLALIWLIQGNTIAIDFSWHKLIPAWNDTQSWVSLTAIMTAFLGMELAAVHVKNIDNPQRNFPRAILYSALLILTTMILGSLAIAFVLPTSKISLVDGVIQAFKNFLNAYHLSALMPVTAILLLIGSIGGMINWIISPAKGLMKAAEHGFLPLWMAHRNQHDVPHRILLLQAVLVTLFSTMFLLLPSINAIYWLFTDLSTEMYIVMYVFMFLAAIKQKEQFAHRPRFFTIPGGRIGYHGVCILGLIGCGITLVVGFIPPVEAVQLGERHLFRLIFSTGIVLMLLPAVLIYWHKKRALNRDLQ